MNQIELGKFFEEKFAFHLSHSADTKRIRIDIEQKLVGNIDISSTLLSGFFQVEFRSTSKIDVLQYEIILVIHNSFEKIFLDYRYPEKVTVQDCAGQTVVIGETLEHEFSFKKFIDLQLFSCEVNEIKINYPVNRLIVDNINNCDKFYIRSLIDDSIPINLLHIDGSIKVLTINDVISEDVLIRISENESFTSAVLATKLEAKILKIDAHNPYNLYLNRAKIEDIRILSHKRVNTLKIDSSEVKKIELNFFQGEGGQFSFKRLRMLKQLKFICYDEKKPLPVENVSIIDTYLEKEFLGDFYNLDISNGLHFEKFTNRGEFRFDDVRLKGEPMTVIKSVLGKTSFFNCDLTNVIKFDTSNIEEILFYNTNPPKDILTTGQCNLDRFQENQKTIFRQLKIASSKSGDKEAANEYRSKELSAYYNMLNWVDQRRFSIHFFEKLAIWANKSNDNGQDWGRTVRIMIMFSFVMYGLFLHSFGYQIDVYTPQSFTLLCKLWSNYFDFVIPGYLYPSKNKLVFVNDLLPLKPDSKHPFEFTNLPLKSKVIVYLNDIIIMPYLIIQMISAFRRHVGKE